MCVFSALNLLNAVYFSESGFVGFLLHWPHEWLARRPICVIRDLS